MIKNKMPLQENYNFANHDLRCIPNNQIQDLRSLPKFQRKNIPINNTTHQIEPSVHNKQSTKSYEDIKFKK